MPKMIHARRKFYIDACQSFEIIYAYNHSILIAPAYESFDTTILCSTLDQNLPPLVDAAQMSDDLLQKQIDQLVMEDPPESLDWVINSPQEGHEEVSLEKAKMAIDEFTRTCIQANMLGLNPGLNEFVYDMASKRFQLPDDDSWDQAITEHVLQQQLQWMRLVVLPWYSYSLQEMDDAKDGSQPQQVRKASMENWYEFLRNKIVLEHTFYKAFYDSR